MSTMGRFRRSEDAGRLRRGWLQVTLPLFLVGCPYGAELEDPDAFFGGENALVPSDVDGVFTCDPEPALSKCAGSICHGRSEDGADPSGTIELFEDGFEEALVDRSAAYEGVRDPQNCPEQPELIVDTTNPSESLLLKKVRGDHSCGDPMPVRPLSEDEIACLTAWVEYLAAKPR